MRLGTSTEVWDKFPPEIKGECVDRAIDTLLVGSKHYFRMGVWYKVRIDLSEEKDSEEYSRIRVVMDYDEIPTERVVIKTPEQICLAPTKSLRQKIKNCYKYLTHGYSTWCVIKEAKEDGND